MGKAENNVAVMMTLALAGRIMFYVGQCDCHLMSPDFVVTFNEVLFCPICGKKIELEILNMAGKYDATKPRSIGWAI